MELNNLTGKTFLLGVGAQKAGTSWLYRYLVSHPEIFVSPIKEMHFFGTRENPKGWPTIAFRRKLRERSKQHPYKRFTALRERIKMKGDISSYINFFQTRMNEETVFGEITPAYSNLDINELKLIKSSFSSTKVIFLLRNPVDRLWSQMRFMDDSKNAGDPGNWIKGITEHPLYLVRSNYAAAIQNLDHVFPPENIHYEFYETLFCAEAVRTICSFLNTGFHPAKFDTRYNVSPKVQLGPERRQILVDLLREQYAFAFEKFGDKLPDSWKDDARQATIPLPLT